MRARTDDGDWLNWGGRAKGGQGCVESNPWQQGWFVPHDPEGLIRLMGGKRRFTEELDAFFKSAPPDFRWNDAYNHPNEPCHTLPFLFALSEKPEEVGRWTQRICAQAYGTGPFGLCGVGIRDVLFSGFDVKTANPPVFGGNARSPVTGIRREGFVLNGVRLDDGEVQVDCSDASPLRRAPKGFGQAITRPRKDGKVLPNSAKSY